MHKFSNLAKLLSSLQIAPQFTTPTLVYCYAKNKIDASLLEGLIKFAPCISELSETDISKIRDAIILDTDDDPVSEIIETVLAKYSESKNTFAKTFGEFYTPPEIVEVIISKIGTSTNYDSLYDPTSGSGRLLFEAAKRLGISKVYGQELLEPSLLYAKISAALLNIQGNFYGGDTLKAPKFVNAKFPLIVANPPWNLTGMSFATLSKLPHFQDTTPLVPKCDGNGYFIQHILSNLADDGKAYIILDLGSMNSKRNRNLRQKITEAGWLKSITLMPPKLFRNTTLPCVIYEFDKTHAGQPTLITDYTKDKSVEITCSEFEANDWSWSYLLYLQEPLEIKPLSVIVQETREFTTLQQKNAEALLCAVEELDAFLDSLTGD